MTATYWQADADALIGLNRQYGIRTFKIDGVMMPDSAPIRTARDVRAADGRDPWAGGLQPRRDRGTAWGYHYGNEYGNIFWRTATPTGATTTPIDVTHPLDAVALCAAAEPPDRISEPLAQRQLAMMPTIRLRRGACRSTTALRSR